MASLLVYVDPARVAGLAPGASWTILPDDIAASHLDERGSLFVVTVEAGRARVVAVHDGVIETGGSEARVFDHDITAIVPRLGCSSVESLMTWTTPRIVPPGDVVLLRYTLGLPVDDPEPPDLGLVIRDDPMARQLRAAVFDDLAADGPRLVYADYLATRGDPRGELINLQLARARDGGPVTTREERLLRSHALDCVDEELRPYLRPHVELARGFVVRCVTRADVPIPPHVIDLVAWSTVEDLGTSRVELARSRRLVSARTLRIHGHELTALVESEQVLPYETVLGWSDHGQKQPGVHVDEASWAALCRRGAFGRLRALSLDGVRNIPFERFGATPLGRTLEQLDVYTRLGGHQAIALRDMFERCELPLLTIRVPLAGGPAADACLVLARGDHGTRLAVQLERPLDAPRITELLRRIAPLSTGLRRIVVEDTGDPANIAERQRELIARLAPMFRDIVARPVPIERLGL